MRSRFTSPRLFLIGSFAVLAILNTVANVSADTPEPQESQNTLTEPLTLKVGRVSQYWYSGMSGDRLGAGLVYGDLNGDGQGDLVIGAPGLSVPESLEPPTGYEAGAIWVTNKVFHPDFLSYGKYVINGFRVIDLVAYGPGQSQRIGSALAVGDLNGDGHPDLVVGNPNYFEDHRDNKIGIVHILFGPMEFGQGFISEIADLSYIGTSERPTGLRVAVGDLNNDGVDDLVVTYKSRAEFRQRGIEVFFGPIDSESPKSLGDPDVWILRSSREHQVGASVAIGDVNGDESDDLLIGLPSAPRGGQVFVGFGPLPSGGVQIEDLHGFSFSGGETNQALGTAFAIGDLDGDGWNDLVTSDRLAAVGDNSRAGTVYVVRGPIHATSEIRISEADIVIEGDMVAGKIGSSLVIADVDNDGVQDLVIGAHELDNRDPNLDDDWVANNNGMVYIIIGDVFSAGSTSEGSLFSREGLTTIIGIEIAGLAAILLLGGLGMIAAFGIWVVFRNPPLLGGGHPEHKDDPDSPRWF
jgi:hypothetical protein